MDDNNLEAERAAFESVMPEAYPRCRNMPDKSYNSPQLHERWIGWQACVEYQARRAPAVGEDGLPPLRGGASVMALADEFGSASIAYTAEQVRQAQRDAVAADRAARGMVPSQVKSPEQPASAAQVVIEWQFRIPPGTDYGSKEHIGAMKAEIADLRARLAGLSQEDA